MARDVRTLTELLTLRASISGDRVAFRFVADGFAPRTLSYRELYLQAQGVAAVLQAQSSPGQRALLLYPAGLDFIVAFFGCLLAGVVAVPAYPPRKNRHTERLLTVVNDADAQLLLSTADTLQRIDSVVAPESVLRTMPRLATDRVPSDAIDSFRPCAQHGDSLAFLQYTSGSTGRPKGVTLSHGNLMDNLARISTGFGTNERDALVSWLPLYHDMGLIGGILEPVYAAIETTLLAPAHFLQRPSVWLETISAMGATISGGPNFAYELCLDRIADDQLERLDLSQWEVAFNGAEPIRAATLERFARRFARCGFRPEAFYPCYGLAEATLLVSGGSRRGALVTHEFDLKQATHCLSADRAKQTTPLVSCGTHFAEHDMRIVDPETLKECRPGEIGEIWFAGPSVSKGYWNQPAATEETFGGRLPDSPRRYLRTGDLGTVTDGELFVTGRLKETIIVRGVNYYPFDIEQVVAEACAGLPHTGCAAFAVTTAQGEELAIAVEAVRHQKLTAQQVADPVCRQLAESHGIAPAAVFIVRPRALPRTSSGKLQRLACLAGIRESEIPLIDTWRRPGFTLPGSSESLHQEEAASQLSEGPCDVQGVVVDVLSRQTTVASGPLTEATRLDDLGLDSLAWMEAVASFEEQLGVQLEESELAKLTTIGDLVSTLSTNQVATSVPRRLDRGDYDFALSPEYLQFKETLRLTQRAGVENPYFTVHEGTTADRTTIEGREYLNFCSYNYLGMSGDPAVTRAAQLALTRYGSSVSASRLVSGEKPIHAELEAEIASWLGVDAAISLVGGHATNVTTIGHLFGPGDLVLHDALAHNSIVQGCQLSGAERRVFRHNDPRACEQLLRRLRSEYRRVLIAIEGVYSMDGDVAPLPEFVHLKEQFKAYLLVDEAHSLGTIGPEGRGIAAHFNLAPQRVDLWMGTLSKSLGSCGGYIAASSEIVEYLRYTAPGFVYSVGMTPANTAAALTALRQLKRHPERVERLQQNSAYFLELAREQSLDTGESAETPIVPVITGSSVVALQLSQRLFLEGINVQPILYPAVEERAARLRFFITCDHTREQIEQAVAATARHWRALQQQMAAA